MAYTGIYKIQSKLYPNRIYIGSSEDVGNRWKDHIRRSKKGSHINGKLQNHINKYGIKDLEFFILEECNVSELIFIEQKFIDDYNPYFNICKTAYSRLGLKHTEITKNKMSNSHKGIPLSEKHKEGLKTHWHKRPQVSEITRKKHSEANIKNRNTPPSQKGKKRSPETIQKMKDAWRIKREEKLLIK